MVALPPLYPPDLVGQRLLWPAVRLAADFPGAVASDDGWTRVLVAGARALGDGGAALVLRDPDWVLLRAALEHDPGTGATPQDAPLERVLARHLARLDGLDGTSGEGRWGRLALEVVAVRRPGRFADTVSLRWTASWGAAGSGAGSEGRATGWGDRQTLSDLGQHRVVVQGRPYRVRTLPDWEREQAARDLGLPPAHLMAWPVVPLATLVALFDDQGPARGPDPGDGAPPHDSHPGPGPQDAR